MHRTKIGKYGRCISATISSNIGVKSTSTSATASACCRTLGVNYLIGRAEVASALIKARHLLGRVKSSWALIVIDYGGVELKSPVELTRVGQIKTENL